METDYEDIMRETIAEQDEELKWLYKDNANLRHRIMQQNKEIAKLEGRIGRLTDNGVILVVRPFEMGTDKEAAIKVLEEASEVRAAWQSYYDDISSLIEYPASDDALMRTCRLSGEAERLEDEVADVIQAACNLASRYGMDLISAMERCEERNRKRGRYDQETAE